MVFVLCVMRFCRVVSCVVWCTGVVLSYGVVCFAGVLCSYGVI